MTRKDVSDQNILAITGRELQELSDFFISDAASEHSMMLDMIDGYLTAVIIGPVTVLPDRWLPFVWDMSGGGKEPKFESLKQAQHIVDLLMKMSDRITMELLYTDSFKPLPDATYYGREEDRDNAIKLWAAGFFSGVQSNSSDWESINADKSASTLLLAMSMFMVNGDNSIPPISIERLRALWETMPEFVRVINDFWHPGQRSEIARARAMAIATETERTGRNEPCPCGSGKKFKKCCGR